jgi:hypothetical protein
MLHMHSTGARLQGMNWANYNISVSVNIQSQTGVAMLCGRVPIWQPANFRSQVNAYLNTVNAASRRFIMVAVLFIGNLPGS